MIDFDYSVIANPSNRDLLSKQAILICYAGSKSYGTEIDSSDTDYKGVFVYPTEEYLSPFPYKDHLSWKDDSQNCEGTIYELKRFINLACQGNPNVIEALFLDDDRICFVNSVGRELLAHRNLFLSQKLRNTFIGYAIAQLKKIKVNHGNYQYYLPSNLKDAMHLVRLLRMGEEVLLTGKLNVFRKDASELLKIRSGEVSYQEILNYAETKIAEIDLIIANKYSILPTEVDYESIKSLTIKLIKMQERLTY